MGIVQLPSSATRRAAAVETQRQMVDRDQYGRMIGGRGLSFLPAEYRDWVRVDDHPVWISIAMSFAAPSRRGNKRCTNMPERPRSIGAAFCSLQLLTDNMG